MKLDGGLYFDFDLLKQTVKEEKMTMRELRVLKDVIDEKILMVQNTSIFEWFATKPIIEGNSTKMVYLKYSNWCEINNQLRENKLKLGGIILYRLHLKSKVFTIDGKSVRIYKAV